MIERGMVNELISFHDQLFFFFFLKLKEHDESLVLDN